jgi:hypothetical protein
MRTRTASALLIAGLVALGACAQAPAPRGTLSVTIVGLPPGSSAAVTITGPNDYETTVTSDESLSDLPVGSYTLTPAAIDVANTDHAGDEHFEAPPQHATIAANATTDVTISYGYTGSTMTDPAGDAAGAGPTEYVYDVVEVTTRLVGGDLVLTITLVDSQDDLDFFLGIVELDADQDPSTGAPSVALEEFCWLDVPFGVEYSVWFDATEDQADIEDHEGTTVGAAGVSTDANSLSLTIPLATIDSDGRVNVVTTVGNVEEPTDCVPFGTVIPPF